MASDRLLSWGMRSKDNSLLIVSPNLHGQRRQMVPHFRTLAWKTPWTEEPGRLQTMGSLRVGHD